MGDVITYRGQLSSTPDWSDWVADGQYHPVDCSSIVPAGTKAVILQIWLQANAQTAGIFLQRYGTTSPIQEACVYAQQANVIEQCQAIVFLSNDLKFQYLLNSGVTYTYKHVWVVGWIGPAS